MQSLKQQTKKYLFVSRGPGEAGQAVALAEYFRLQGEEIVFCFVKEKNNFFLKKQKGLSKVFTPNFADFEKTVKKEKPEAIFFFNSKMWPNALKKRPACLKNIKCYGVDSNWLFNNQKHPQYSFFDWADKYFVLFPKKIFQLGLKNKKGNFEIKKPVLEKIRPAGFVPSYSPPPLKTIAKVRNSYGVTKGEKLIFAYFSGYGAGQRIWALENLVKAVDWLQKKRKMIKVVCVGPTENLNLKKLQRPWLIFKDKLEGSEYFATLASADLIFQHQGMVTLAQAISANVPVIANVSVLKDEALPFIHFWEVEPFAKARACLMFKKSDSSQKIAQAVEKLLFDKKAIGQMKKAQKQILSKGEKTIYSIIKQSYETTKNRANLPA